MPQATSRILAKSKPEVREPGKHGGAECAPQTVPRPRPVSKPVTNAVPIPVTPPRKSPAEDIPPPVVHASLFGETDEELSELSDEPTSKPITKARLRTRSTKSITAKPSLDLSPPLPVTKRAAKRRLVVDSDEETQATTKVVHKVAAVSLSVQDMKAETASTELVKTSHIHNRRSPTMQSSTDPEGTSHPEMNLPPVLQKPPTSSSGDIHPGMAVNAAMPCLGENIPSVSPCEIVPTTKLLPEATTKPTPPEEQVSVARGRALRHVSPSRLPGSSDPLPKLAGTRRQRDDTKSTTGVPLASDDRPPRKKPRKSTTGIETKRANGANESIDPLEPSTASTTSVKNTKKYGKRGKPSSPIPPGHVDFDEVPGADPKGKTNTRAKATRGAPKPVQKKLPARQTRATAMRRKNEKPASPEGVSSRIKSLEPEIEEVAGPRLANRTTDVVLPNNEVVNDFLGSFKPESTPSKQAEKVCHLFLEPRYLTHTRRTCARA